MEGTLKAQVATISRCMAAAWLEVAVEPHIEDA
jgi:hypothetical protein